MKPSISHKSPTEEAYRLHLCVFGQPPRPILVERFAALSLRIDLTASGAEKERYYRILDNAPDLEAVEFAARITKRVPLLTRKFRAIVALAETLPENQDFFINRHAGWLTGALACFWACLWALYKLPVGLWYLRQVGRD